MKLKFLIMVSLESLLSSYEKLQSSIRERLAEFATVGREADDKRLFEELAYCIFTAGASARMGLKSVAAVKDILLEATVEQLEAALRGVHRYPRARADYLVRTRSYLVEDCGLGLRQKLESFSDAQACRDYFAANKQVVGVGYKEASHFLRNIGKRGYAILDRHVLRCLSELGVVSTPQPPANRSRYLEIEQLMKRFAEQVGIDFDELDLLLWSQITGEVLK
ncbi:MAG: N-glycosylase/DNA lyase [Acidobacteriota bacterium]|nr:N-glycosylase/DNA lyase [Blastocatellia bacterium]MDW8413401.1 N-glycosylase/DNA lyase [Acidobacteriota bacterium]